MIALPYQDNKRKDQTDNIDSDLNECNNDSETGYVPDSEIENEDDADCHFRNSLQLK